jgi:hypothetical protein
MAIQRQSSGNPVRNLCEGMGERWRKKGGLRGKLERTYVRRYKMVEGVGCKLKFAATNGKRRAVPARPTTCAAARIPIVKMAGLR